MTGERFEDVVIRWKDTKGMETVVFGIGPPNHDDDDVFFWVDSIEEIMEDNFMEFNVMYLCDACCSLEHKDRFKILSPDKCEGLCKVCHEKYSNLGMLVEGDDVLHPKLPTPIGKITHYY